MPARLRQHLPRLVGQLQPGPRPALQAALRPRRIQPTPHRAHIHPADLGAHPHVRRRQRPRRIQLQQPCNQHRPGQPQPRRDLTPRTRLPHPTPFHPRKPSPATVPPRSAWKDQNCRSQDSGAERGVPAHDSRAHCRHRSTAVTLPLPSAPPAKTPSPDAPSLTPTHQHKPSTSQPAFPPFSSRTSLHGDDNSCVLFLALIDSPSPLMRLLYQLRMLPYRTCIPAFLLLSQDSANQHHDAPTTIFRD
ncbi:hypothetical protein RKD27_000081 [Streptomyces sp. SAI-126]